jgi:putative N6-adenine-specific DNA methylase
MTKADDVFEIFLVAAPGTEAGLLAEAKRRSFAKATLVAGGVTIHGNWREVWRANLELRIPSKVLVRVGSFHVAHLAQLDKLARKFPWPKFLRKDVAISVETTCKKSKIYHAGAATQRIETALREEFKATISADAKLNIKARIENNLCTISIDSSGETLHKRGHKQAIGKAPMRENLAAYFLNQCGFDGKEPVVDPMCGSGTFVLEAAEIASNLKPGRDREFAFELLKSFDAVEWQKMRAKNEPQPTAFKFYGSDRDEGAIRMSLANAEISGLSHLTSFQPCAISNVLPPPETPPGLVIINPPYGTRIGDKKPLFALYAALGQTLKTHFKGWRVGIITTEKPLAIATGLEFEQPPHGPINHGGLRVYLFKTKALV